MSSLTSKLSLLASRIFIHLIIPIFMHSRNNKAVHLSSGVMLKLSLRNSKLHISESKTDFIIVHARTHVLKSTICHLVIPSKKKTKNKKTAKQFLVAVHPQYFTGPLRSSLPSLAAQVPSLLSLAIPPAKVKYQLHLRDYITKKVHQHFFFFCFHGYESHLYILICIYLCLSLSNDSLWTFSLNGAVLGRSWRCGGERWSIRVIQVTNSKTFYFFFVGWFAVQEVIFHSMSLLLLLIIWCLFTQ